MEDISELVLGCNEPRPELAELEIDAVDCCSSEPIDIVA